MPFVVSLSLFLSRFPSLSLAWLHKRTSEMHIYTHTLTCPSPLFRSLPFYISNPALSLSSLFRTPSLRSSGQFSRFLSPHLDLFSPAYIPRSSQSNKIVQKERERRKEKAGVKLPPSSPTSITTTIITTTIAVSLYSDPAPASSASSRFTRGASLRV